MADRAVRKKAVEDNAAEAHLQAWFRNGMEWVVVAIEPSTANQQSISNRCRKRLANNYIPVEQRCSFRGLDFVDCIWDSLWSGVYGCFRALDDS